MSKVCSITGSKVTRGSIIHRRGMAKKKGGVGRHVTKNVPRTFRSEERRVGKEWRSLCDWSSDVCSSDLLIGLRWNCRLTQWGVDASLRTLFGVDYVKSLQHHRIQSHARQHYSPARYGEEEGRSGASRNEKRAAHL